MFEERLETIRSVCENLKLQNKPTLRIKNKRQVITSHKPKTRKIPKWCIDRMRIFMKGDHSITSIEIG